MLWRPSLYFRAFSESRTFRVPSSQSLSPMPALAIRAYTATTALGRGREALADALRERRSGLRRNDFGNDATAGRG